MRVWNLPLQSDISIFNDCIPKNWRPMSQIYIIFAQYN